jgi:hypothetical protein
VTYRDRHRLDDNVTAIDAIRAHLARGGLSDGLVFDAVQRRPLAVPRRAPRLDPTLENTLDHSHC